MKDEKATIGSTEHIEMANAKFEETFNRMMSLMSGARSIEFKIRMAAEVQETIEHFKDKDYQKFIDSKYKYPNKKLHKQLADLLPKDDQEKMLLIKQIADNLAHAGYYEAGINIREFIISFSLKSTISDKKIGFYYLNSIQDENGDIVDYAYLLEPNDENLILESFEVFEKQGYSQAWFEIADIANSILAHSLKNIGYKYEMIQIPRTYKRGEKLLKSNKG